MKGSRRCSAVVTALGLIGHARSSACNRAGWSRPRRTRPRARSPTCERSSGRTARSRSLGVATRTASCTRSPRPPTATTPSALTAASGTSVMSYLAAGAAAACTASDPGGVRRADPGGGRRGGRSRQPSAGEDLLSHAGGRLRPGDRRVRQRRGFHPGARHPGAGGRRGPGARGCRHSSWSAPRTVTAAGTTRTSRTTPRRPRIRHQRHQLDGDGADGAGRRR